MATGLRTISIRFVGDAKRLNSATGSAGKQIEGLRKRFGGLKTAITGGFLGGFAANLVTQGISKVKDFFGESIQGWRDHQKVMAQTAQVVRSTGGAAKVSAKHVGALSDAIEKNTGVDGDLVQSGANMLLTFTNIRNGVGKNNKIFDRATQTVTDMSVALGQDTKNSAIQLGKALNDPVKGVTALQRVGVSFTAGQKKQIDQMVKSGNVMGAQKLILRELGKEFGGSAKAQQNGVDKMMVAVHALQDQIGQALVPIIDKAAGVLTAKVIPAISTVITWLTKNGDTIKSVVSQAAPFVGIILAVVAAIKIWTIVQAALNVVMALNPVGLIVIAIAALIAIIVVVATKTRFFQTVWAAVWGFLKKVGAWFAGPFVGFFKAVGNKIRSSVTSVKDWITSKWNQAVRFVRGIPGKVWSAIRSLWDRPRRDASTMTVYVRGKLNALVSWVRGLPGRIAHAASGMWNGIKNAFRGALNWIIGKWNGLSFTVPGINVPFFGKVGGFTLSTPNIPYLAKGGRVLRGGLAVVGEHGPELEQLPTGATVTPLDKATGPPRPLEVHIEIGGEVVRVVRTEIDEHDRATVARIGAGTGAGLGVFA